MGGGGGGGGGGSGVGGGGGGLGDKGRAWKNRSTFYLRRVYFAAWRVGIHNPLYERTGSVFNCRHFRNI